MSEQMPCCGAVGLRYTLHDAADEGQRQSSAGYCAVRQSPETETVVLVCCIVRSVLPVRHRHLGVLTYQMPSQRHSTHSGESAGKIEHKSFSGTAQLLLIQQHSTC